MVDDETSNIVLMERALERVGYRYILGVHDSRLAVERFVSFKPDLVILDLLMPEMDGYQVLACLREVMRGASAPVPILVLTADVSAFARCWELGARDFMTKPIDALPVLWARVENLLELRFTRLELAARMDDGR